MKDSILIARLDALQQKLVRVEKWLNLGLQGVQVDQELLDSLDYGINQEARRQANAVGRVLRKLENAGENDDETLEKAWLKYAEIDAQSQDIFQECLELIGGLAIRDNEITRNFYWVADELIRNCARTSTGSPWLSFTVPAQREREAMKKVMGRIVRLRFPEWTIWSLPLTAHEYGHEVVQEKDLRSKVGEQAEEWNQYHLDEILADSFATYTMGPAYACTAISLRLNPSGAYTDNYNRLADAKRAHVIFSMLWRMNDEANNESQFDRDPYKDIIMRLEQQWKTVLGRIKLPGELGAVDAKRLEDLVDKIIGEIFPDVFRPPGEYHHGEHGWKLATTWANRWYTQLEANQNLDIPDLSKAYPLPELRDALNAAWLCRSRSEQDKVKEITEAAYTLCNEIRQKRHPEQSQGHHRTGLHTVQRDRRDASQVDVPMSSQVR